MASRPGTGPQLLLLLDTDRDSDSRAEQSSCELRGHTREDNVASLQHTTAVKSNPVLCVTKTISDKKLEDCLEVRAMP